MAHHRGQYAQANSVVYPFFKHLDMNVTQDIYFYPRTVLKKTSIHCDSLWMY